MLVIRQKQIDTLIKKSDEEFVEFLFGHVKKEQPDFTSEYKDETLREMVRNGIKRAERYNFSTAEDITAFVSIMFEIAPNFDQPPPIKAVLEDEKFSPAKRLERLWSPLVTEEDWANAEDAYDEKAWGYTEQNAANDK